MLEKMGQQLPLPWRNVPTVENPQYHWCLNAFSELSSCRSFGFSAGPIPWTVLQEYCDREEIKEREEFTVIVRELDREYLNYIKEQQEKDK